MPSTPATIYPFNTPVTPAVSVADQKAIEDAIQAAIVGASGLAPGRVIWGNQSGDRPGTFGDRDLISLFWGNTSPFAEATPEQFTEDTAGSPAGEEVTITTLDHEQVSLIVNYYTGKNTGNTSARSRLKAVRNKLNSETYSSGLMDSAISLMSIGPVQSVSVVLETEVESRARMELVLGLVDGAIEKVTNIVTAELTGTYT